MSPARAAAYLGCGILLAGWLASAAGVVRPSTARFPRRSAEAMQLDAVASNVQSQAARLRHRLAAAPAPQAPVRNPFTFVESPASPVAVPRPAVTAVPIVVEQSLPEPDLILLGVAEQGSTRTAMMASGDDLLMATEGQTVVGRYRVGKVTADAIELIDIGTGVTRRLTLKSPVSLL